MQPQGQQRVNATWWLVWLVSGACEWPFIQAILASDPSRLDNNWGLGVALHILGSTLLWFAVPRGRGLFHQYRLWARTALLFCLPLPLFGWLTTAVIVIFAGGELPQPKAEEDEFLPAPTELASLQSPAQTPQERIALELDIMALPDILSGTDNDLKRGAIEKLARLRSPDAIEILLRYRSDPSPEVRFYVTSALVKVKREMDEELNAAKLQLTREEYKISARIFLAKIYLRQSESGLLDEVTAAAFRREVQHHLESSIGSGGTTRSSDSLLPPDNPLARTGKAGSSLALSTKSEYANRDAFILLAGLYRADGEWEKALDMLDECERRGKETHVGLAQLRSGIAFECGRYATVVDELRCLRREGQPNAEWHAIINWWGAGA